MKIDPKKKKILETIENELKFWKKFVDHQFDELDIKIILALREDGRMSDSELAKLLEVSTSTISRRRTALIEKGYLKIVGMLILQNVGLTYVDVFIELSKDAKSKDVEEFIAEVEKYPQVYEIDQYFEKPEILIRVFEKNQITLFSFIRDLLTDKDIVHKYTIKQVLRSPKLFDQPMKEPYKRIFSQ